MIVDLPGAGGADDEDELALVDHERDAVERRHVRLVDLADVLEHDHRGAARRGRAGGSVRVGGRWLGECRRGVVS